MKKILFSSLLLAAALGAQAEDFPTPTLYAPALGVSNFTTVCVVWDFQNITLVDGRPDITIKTPSGDEYTSKAYTEFVLEDDRGGSLDGSNPDGENALSVSYFNVLNSSGEGIAKSFDQKGIYTIYIPAGVIAIDGVPNPAAELTYNLGYLPLMEAASYNFISGEDESYLLQITWNHQELKTTRAASNGFSGFFNNIATGAQSEIFNALFTMLEDNTVLQVNLSGSIFEDGDYSFEFPTNQVQNSQGYVNPAQTFTFSVGDTGIDGIASEGTYSVYDLNGVKIMETREAAFVKALPAGLYVINGKKIVIR